MPVIGFNFTTSHIYYVILDGTKVNPVYIIRNRIAIPLNHTIPQLMDWFHSELSLVLNSHRPSAVSYKLGLANISNNLVQHVYYAQGILNLLCYHAGIQSSNIAGQSLVPNRFNQPKGTNLHAYIDQLIGTHAPHWDVKMRDSALIALNLLP